MEEKISKTPLRDAAIATGIATDNMLALMGQAPCAQIANVIVPSQSEQDKLCEIHATLDRLTAHFTAKALRACGEQIRTANRSEQSVKLPSATNL